MKKTFVKIIKNKTVAVVTFLFILTLAGFSFAYFTLQISGTGKDVNIQAGVKELTISKNHEINFGQIFPGWSDSTKISITNTGTVPLYYNLVWESITNDLTRPQDLTMSITSTNSGGVIPNTQVASTGTNVSLIDDILINANTTQEYTITFNYARSSTEDQSVDSDKLLEGIINITPSTKIIDTPQEIIEIME